MKTETKNILGLIISLIESYRVPKYSYINININSYTKKHISDIFFKDLKFSNILIIDEEGKEIELETVSTFYMPPGIIVRIVEKDKLEDFIFEIEIIDENILQQ